MVPKYGISGVAGSGRVACGWRWQASAALVVFLVAACGDPNAPEAVTWQPAPRPNSPAWVWGLVVEESGVCIAGATATVVGGQGVGQSIQQEIPCDAWAYSGGFLFTNLTPGVPMTIRASAPAYAEREMTVVPSSGPQAAVLFVLSPSP